MLSWPLCVRPDLGSKHEAIPSLATNSRYETVVGSAAVHRGRQSAIISRPGHHNEVLLAHFRMLAEKLRTESKTQLAKLALGLRLAVGLYPSV